MVKLRFNKIKSRAASDSAIGESNLDLFRVMERNDIKGRMSRPFIDILTVKLAKEGYSNMPLAMQLSNERISYMVGEGKIYLPQGWEIKWQARKIAIETLLEFLGKSSENLSASDLKEHSLENVLSYYSNNIESLKSDLELEDEGASKRRKAIQQMVNTSGKKPEEITIQHFKDAGLFYILTTYYGGSPYLALIDSGYDLDEWKMKNAPKGTWDKKENLAKAIIWLKQKTGKELDQLTASDFHKHGLGGLVTKYGGVSAVFNEIGIKINKYIPQKKEKGYWSNPTHILKAVKDLEERTGKNRFSLTYTDFVDAGYRGLLKAFEDNLSKLKVYLRENDPKVGIIAHKFKKNDILTNEFEDIMDKAA